MDKETYIERRNELLEKGQKLINEGKISEFNDIKAQIEKLDNDYEADKKAQANLKALQDNHKVTDITKLSKNITGEIVASTGSKNISSAFLNKGEKLADRIILDDEEQIFNKPGALAELIRGTVTGNWQDKELKNAITTTTSGVLIPSVLSSKIIDKARDISLFTSAGVPVAPMETNNLKISRVKTDPTFAFKSEGTAATESSFELDDIELKSKTVYGYAYLTIEAIESSINLENIVQQTFANAIAQAIDKAFLYGQGSGDTFAPSGIINDTNINSITATQSAGYDDIIKAIGKVKQANGTPTVIGINSQTEELLALLKDSQGNYLAKPKVVESLNTIVSNQLKYSSSDGSDALIFDPEALLIGIQKNLSMKIIEDKECLQKGLIGIQLYSMQDCKTVYPKHICKVTGIK